MRAPKNGGASACVSWDSVRTCVTSCTSRWGLENKKRSDVERDLRRRRRDLVAQAAGLAQSERLASEGITEPFGSHPLRVACHGQQRDEGAHRTLERERSGAAQRPDAHRAASCLDLNAVVPRIGEEQQVRGLVVEAWTAERTEEDDPPRSRRDGVRDRKLEIGLILRRGELRDADALARETLDARVAERVHVAHDQMGKDLPALEG